MKAPSVREGSKENGTQVTGNRIYKGCLVRQRILAARLLSNGRSQTLHVLLQEMVENLFTGLWLANPRLRLGTDPQKFPRCRSRSGDGDRHSTISLFLGG
jgi:hypothetical protein